MKTSAGRRADHRSEPNETATGIRTDTAPGDSGSAWTGAFRRIARQVGLEVVSIQGLRHYPYYLMFSPLLFRLGVWYDRLITRWGLDSLQPTILAIMKKTP